MLAVSTLRTKSIFETFTEFARKLSGLCDRRTLFQGVQSINPGHYLTLTSFSTITQHKYWDLDFKDKVC